MWWECGNKYQLKCIIYEGTFVEVGWYDLRVEADSSTGELGIFIDNVLIFTHLARTNYRSGMSGVYSGNQVGYLDDFRLTSNDISPVPEPMTLLLFGPALLGLIVYKSKKV